MSSWLAVILDCNSVFQSEESMLPKRRLFLTTGKSNCYLDLERSQSSPIYKIAVDILKHTNFFKAFTASSTISSIYIQQFWDIVRYDKTAGCYKCQVDEQWFDLTKDTLRDALQITPVNNNKAFSFPSYSDALIKFVNKLGYPKLVRNLSNVGVINRAYLDYAERIWEEFTQSIHTFIEDKKNLAQHTHGKKKATLIVIPSIQFTKLIIYHLQRKHKFQPRPDSPLHLPNEEPALGYLKFSAKGTKREVFGMPIPSNLITTDIQGKSYYQEYLAKVAKHQRYLAGETGSDPDSPAPKPTKTTKKSKPTAPKAALRPSVTKPAPSQQTEPQPAPAKTQGKKRKLVTEISDKPSQARKPKPGLVSKRRKPISSLRSVDEFVTEGIPEKEPRVDDEEADVEVESDKDVSGINAGVQVSQPLPCPVVHAGSNLEHMDFEVAYVSTQPHPKQMDEGFTATAYPKVQDNLNLTVEEHVILQEPASSTGTLSSLQHLMKDLSFGDLFFNDKPSKADNEKATTETEVKSMVSVTIQLDTSAIPPMTTPVVDLTLSPDEVESDKDVSGINTGVQGEGQARPNPDDQDEGQAGPHPDEQAEGQARPNPGDVAVAYVSTQPHPKQMDEGFTATAYPKVQDNLNLTVEEHVILEEPASSTGTLSYLQHLTKDLSFGDLFFNDKPSKADNEKETTETEVKSMVSVTIQLDTSAIPPMTTPVVDLTLSPGSPNVHWPLQAMATETTTTTITITTTPPS
nr:E-beta-farnesene synthase [Tanacetum cinerariifolium]